MTGPVLVGPPRLGSAGAIAASVDSVPVAFWSADVVLHPAAEAFAGPAWLLALAGGRELVVSAPVDPTWAANLAGVAALAENWWGLAPRRASVDATRVAPAAAPATALCFTAGVDSFHALLTAPRPPETLAFVHGYDITLDDDRRWAEASAGHRAVADVLGCRAVTVRTNLRDHPGFASIPWGTTHGAALAAVGHLLRDEHGRLLVASTHARTDGRAWGSDWRLDPLWSARDHTVVHVGDDTPREEKIRAIAGHPLVRRHLRVCWEHRNDGLNCSVCDKCLATMVILRSVGALEHMATFDGGADLVPLLDDLPSTMYLAMYPRVLSGGDVPPVVADAVMRLLDRSARVPSDA